MRALRIFFATLIISAFYVPITFAADIESGFNSGVIKKNSVFTEHFRIEFSDLIRNQTDSDGDGFADLIELVAYASEESWDILIGDLSFETPLSVGDRLVVIIDDTYDYLYNGAIGVTSLLSNGDPYIAVDPWVGVDYIEITMAHELLHAIQFGYDIGFANTFQGVNWAEATGVWAEDVVFDDVNDYVNYLTDYFDYVDYSIFASIVPSGTLYEYALNIWPKFLSEYYDNDIVREIWEEYFDSSLDYNNGLKLYDATQNVVLSHGDNLDEIYQEFSKWNLDASLYEEGRFYPDVLLLEDTVQGEYTPIDDVFAPALYGTNYLYFENTGGDGKFYFHIIKSNDLSMGISLVPVKNGNPQIAISESIIVAASEELTDELVLTGLASSDGVIVVVSALDGEFGTGLNADAFDEGYLYYYLAQFGQSIASDIESQDLGVLSSEKAGDALGEGEDIHSPDQLVLSLIDYDADSASFSWDRVTNTDIAGYELWYYREGSDYWEYYSISKPHITFATVPDLLEGWTYHFVLNGVDADGFIVGDDSNEIVLTPTEWIFSDVSYLDDQYDAISSLVDLGIFEGYSDGSFRPENNINRAELLKILIEGQGLTPNENIYKNCFPDVKQEWYAKYVCYAKAQGWVQGYPDGSFKPADSINKVEALKILFEVYEEGLHEGAPVASLFYSDLDGNAWYAIYVWKASVLGILDEKPGTSFDPDDNRTRGDMAEELYRYLVVSEN